MKEKIKIILLIILFLLLIFCVKIYMSKNNSNTNGKINQGEISGQVNIESKVIEVNENNFEEEVLKSEKLVLIDFYADWCEPCKMLSPIIDEVSNEKDNVKFVRIDVDTNDNLATRYQIMYMPTLIIIKNGEEIDRSIGLINKDELLKFVEK